MGPLVTRARCQLTMATVQRARVRPRRRNADRQRHLEGAPIHPREVQRAAGDAIAPPRGLIQQPRRGPCQMVQRTTALGTPIGRARRPSGLCRHRVWPRRVAIIVAEGCVVGPRYVRGVDLEAVRVAMRCERATEGPDPSDVVSVIDPAGQPDAVAASVALPTPAAIFAGTRPVASRSLW